MTVTMLSSTTLQNSFDLNQFEQIILSSIACLVQYAEGRDKGLVVSVVSMCC